jgi:hypothetical protein
MKVVNVLCPVGIVSPWRVLIMVCGFAAAKLASAIPFAVYPMRPGR